MGLFSKKKEEQRPKNSSGLIPSLPKLPDFANMDFEEDQIHKLPSLPGNSLGTKFSQDTIKEAVAGEKEDFDEDSLE